MKVNAVLILSMLLVTLGQAQAPSIAILPVQNQSGEKWADLKEKLTARVQDQLLKQFSDREFAIKGPAELAPVLQDMKIDLTDEENFRKDNFYAIGEKAQVDYVVFFVITHNTQRIKQNFLTAAPEGEVTVKVWLLDVKNRTPLISAKSETAKARPHSFLGVAKGSDQQLTAADRVVVSVLKDFLGQWKSKAQPEPKKPEKKKEEKGGIGIGVR